MKFRSKKFIILATIIFVFTTLLLAPKLTHADDETKILTEKSTLQPGENTIITAYTKVYTLIDTRTVTASFTANGVEFGDSTTECKSDTLHLLDAGNDPAGTEYHVCTTVFSSPVEGTFAIQGVFHVKFLLGIGNFDKKTDTVEVKVTEQKVETTCVAPKILANGKCVDPDIYHLLAPLSDTTTFDPTQKNALSTYLNLMIKILIGLAAVFAVIMIVYGGIQYMTSEFVSSKEEAKKKITNAILGLLIALGAYALLYTINPNLLNIEPRIDQTTIAFEEGPETEVSEAEVSGICGKTIVVNGQTLTSCDQSEITTITFMGKQVNVNKAIVPDLEAVNTAWQNSTDPKIKNYVIKSIGSYNPRSATNSKYPSGHAFGVSLDINQNENPYKNYTSPCITDMPLAFVQLFTSRGFGWGGYYHSTKDAMHFSKKPNETKYSSGTCDGLK